MAEGTVFHLRQPIKLVGSRRHGIELAVTLDTLVVAFQDDAMRSFKMKIARALCGDESGHGMAP
jgi:hypothetical protein